MAELSRAYSGSPFEEQIGFVRAIRVGDRILVSGTAPVWPDNSVHPDAAVQTRRCFEIAGQALEELGSSLEHVVRTRMFILERADAAAVGAVHREVFKAHPPAATMVLAAGFLDERWLVEIELEATVPGDQS
jgi:enamine deaminase RidA (YjgF/YER057c/UK114 family)